VKPKKIKGQVVPSMFFNKKKMYTTFGVAMFGALGGLLFIIKLCCSERYESVVFSNDDWVGLGAALFIFAMFLPMSLILYLGQLIIAILEKIIEENDSKSDS